MLGIGVCLHISTPTLNMPLWHASYKLFKQSYSKSQSFRLACSVHSWCPVRLLKQSLLAPLLMHSLTLATLSNLFLFSKFPSGSIKVPKSAPETWGLLQYVVIVQSVTCAPCSSFSCRRKCSSSHYQVIVIHTQHSVVIYIVIDSGYIEQGTAGADVCAHLYTSAVAGVRIKSLNIFALMEQCRCPCAPAVICTSSSACYSERSSVYLYVSVPRVLHAYY